MAPQLYLHCNYTSSLCFQRPLRRVIIIIDVTRVIEMHNAAAAPRAKALVRVGVTYS